MAQEVTSAWAARAALRQSDDRLRLATDAAGLGIWVWHLDDDRVTWENERIYEMFGLSAGDESINGARFLAEVVHPDDAAQFEYAIQHTLETGERLYFMGRFRRRDGQLRWLELTGRLEHGCD